MNVTSAVNSHTPLGLEKRSYSQCHSIVKGRTAPGSSQEGAAKVGMIMAKWR